MGTVADDDKDLDHEHDDNEDEGEEKYTDEVCGDE